MKYLCVPTYQNIDFVWFAFMIYVIRFIPQQ